MDEGTKIQEEIFDIFSEDEVLIGQAPRSKVHKSGLLHRSTNIFLFNSKGELLIQKRSDTKDICPSKWDLSCAEHLKPKEGYADGALRGLKEELNITVESNQLKKLGAPILKKSDYPELDMKDYEFSQYWTLIFDGEFNIDQDEVVDAKFVSKKDLISEITSNPNNFTPWMLDAIKEFNILD
jgi:isopentenyl-diphosphate delta-isomerase